ncbi:GNAT family N-acetyltransferase [Rubrobacter tropicus]|uniref:GNAT family N-acetyltransferase n=1 Tax=Rubrobacter tropicus TaxID=2653851 RepID=A0A6G8Q4G0_9ACTN|nr:GNAT family N-acetyltransferase [Rubrobacter tropicus]QIN81207.1 GNAT family N-acetyltransferase [Rubrobacter tropicus]
MVEIETDRLLLRGWREEDIEPYARICADPEVMRFIGSGKTLTREQSGAQISRFVRHWEEHGFGLWAAEEKSSGSLLGFVGLAHLEDWTASGHDTEVGWRLDRAYWGRGFATEGAKASVDYGFERFGLATIISIIQPGNTTSRRVAEKTGLTLRGETRWRGIDVVWYAIDRNDPRPES